MFYSPFLIPNRSRSDLNSIDSEISQLTIFCHSFPHIRHYVPCNWPGSLPEDRPPPLVWLGSGLWIHHSYSRTTKLENGGLSSYRYGDRHLYLKQSHIYSGATRIQWRRCNKPVAIDVRRGDMPTSCRFTTSPQTTIDSPFRFTVLHPTPHPVRNSLITPTFYSTVPAYSTPIPRQDHPPPWYCRKLGGGQ